MLVPAAEDVDLALALGEGHPDPLGVVPNLHPPPRVRGGGDQLRAVAAQGEGDPSAVDGVALDLPLGTPGAAPRRRPAGPRATARPARRGGPAPAGRRGRSGARRGPPPPAREQAAPWPRPPAPPPYRSQPDRRTPPGCSAGGWRTARGWPGTPLPPAPRSARPRPAGDRRWPPSPYGRPTTTARPPPPWTASRQFPVSVVVVSLAVASAVTSWVHGPARILRRSRCKSFH